MGASSAISAGRAFVELYLDDSTVQASLDNVKSKLRTFGTAVDTAGSGSFVRMQTAAVTSTAAASASVGVLGATMVVATTAATGAVGVLTATMGVLRASAVAVGVAFRVAFRTISGSVAKAAVGIGALAVLMSRLAPNSKAAGFLNNFLSKSQTTEAMGRWTRFFGALTGSSALKDMGNRMERLGMGASIVKGFQNGGVAGGMRATMGAAFRSAKGMVASGAAGLLTSPLRMTAAVVKAPFRMMGMGGGKGEAAGGGLAGAAGGIGKLSLGGAAFGAMGSAIGGVSAVISSTISAVRTLAVGFTGLAASISGAALQAARNFVTSSQEMIDKSRETGQSLESLISEKYGSTSLISPADIEAGAALSSTMTSLKQAMAAAWAQIGVAALPVLKQLTENMTWAANVVGQFLSQNREMVTTFVQVAAKVAAFGAAFLAASAAVAAVANPIGLVVAAAAGLAYCFPAIRTAAMSAFTYLSSGFAQLGQIVGTVMGGIGDAMSGGNLQAAARVLWAGLNVAWLAGTDSLRSIYRSLVTQIALVGNNVFANLRSAWSVTISFLSSAWASFMNGFSSLWRSAVNRISASFVELFAKLTGQKMEDVAKTLGEMIGKDEFEAEKKQKAAALAREKAAKEGLLQIERERAEVEAGILEQDAEKAAETRRKLEAARKELVDAREEAAKLKKAPNAVNPESMKQSKDVMSGLKDTATLGTFSVAAVGRTNIGGIASLTKASEATADNTKKIADNAGKNPFQWA